MTKKRNYTTEVLEALAEKPANDVTLQRILHMNPDRLYCTLIELEEAGKIEWHLISKTDGVWNISK